MQMEIQGNEKAILPALTEAALSLSPLEHLCKFKRYVENGKMIRGVVAFQLINAEIQLSLLQTFLTPQPMHVRWDSTLSHDRVVQ